MAKTKLTDTLCDEICEDIEVGVPIKHAAISHGISEVTFYNWYNKGKDSTRKNKFKTFYDKVEEAKSKAIALRARRICKAGKSNWQADAWWLERVDPENFGRKDTHKIDMDAKADVNSKVSINDSTDNQVKDFINKLKK